MVKVFSHRALLCAGIVLSMASCVIEQPSGGTDPGSEQEPGTSPQVRIMIHIPPGTFEGGATRALTQAQESEVASLDVLMFDPAGGLVAVLDATEKVSGSRVRQFTIDVPREKVTEATVFDMVALANAAATIDAVSGADGAGCVGKTRDELAAILTAPVTGAMFAAGGPIPMWGEARGVKIDGTDETQVSVRLARAVARVDIGVGQPVRSTDPAAERLFSWNGLDDNGTPIPFVPTEAYIARPGDVISLIPARANVEGNGKVIAPTVNTAAGMFSLADSWEKFAYGFGGEKFSTQEIYIPEARLADGAVGDDRHAERPALIVGGRYNGSAATTYYRVDFAGHGTLIDIVRNRSYQFNIKGVVAPGHATPEAAYQSLQPGMAVEMIEWEEGLVEDIWWGENYLAVRENPARMPARAGQRVDVKLFTNTSPLRLTLGGTTLAPGGSHGTEWFEYSLSRVSGEEYTLSVVTLQDNVSDIESDPRVDRWKIGAGTEIEMLFEVSQFWQAVDASSYTITVDNPDNGFGHADAADAAPGEKVTLSAEPAPGYEFTGWTVVSGAAIVADPTAAETHFIMPKGGVRVRANFAIISYAVTVSSVGLGTAEADVKKQGVDRPVTLTATPFPDQEFLRWEVVKGGPVGSLTPAANPATFTMPPHEVEIRAVFRVKKYDIAFEVVGEGRDHGTVAASPTESEPASDVTVTATPERGYEFMGWTVLAGGVNLSSYTDETARFQMPKTDVTLQARFDLRSYLIAASGDGHGTARADAAKAKAGVRVTLVATPLVDAANDYRFERWVDVKGNIADLTAAANPGTCTMPEGDVEIRAEFVKNTYRILTSDDGKGEVQATAQTSIAGETVTLTAIPSAGYRLYGWKVSGGGVTLTVTGDNEVSFTMPRQEVSVKAEFDFIPVAPYILYLDDNGRLAAGRWFDGTTGTVTQDNMLYFKAGSNIGFTTPARLANETSWYQSIVQGTKFYNPSLLPNSRWGSYYNDVGTTYDIKEGVPGLNPALDAKLDTSSDAYNTVTGAMDGYGDPCRLIGLTQAEAQEMARTMTLHSRNSGFRSPSRNVLTPYESGSVWVQSGGAWGRWLSSNPTTETFLPAGGYRNPQTGAVKYRDEFGFWFSANAGGYAGNMIALQFVEDALEVTNLSSTNGGNIRCEVKK